MYILGVDGGGTKTKATLFHTELGIVWSTQSVATNPHSTSFNHSVKTIIQIIEEAFSANKLSEYIDMYVSIGIAGLGREPERKKWLELFNNQSAHLPPLQKVTIENDGKIALYSATFGGDGIVSICGTGALTFGINQQKNGRVGGWGHLVGDDPGSGYHIGSQALAAVFEEEDGIGKKTRITDLLLKGVGLESVQELVPIIYEKEQVKQQIAAYSRYVFQAAEQGDEVAQHIMNTTAKSIARYGMHLYRKLFAKTVGEVPFVLAGSIFQNQTMVRSVATALREAPQLNVTVVEKEPVIGSIVTALKEQGYSVATIKRLLNDKEMGETT